MKNLQSKSILLLFLICFSLFHLLHAEKTQNLYITTTTRNFEITPKKPEPTYESAPMPVLYPVKEGDAFTLEAIGSIQIEILKSSDDEITFTTSFPMNFTDDPNSNSPQTNFTIQKGIPLEICTYSEDTVAYFSFSF